MAQFDARTNGDQEVAGLIPAGLATFFWEIDHDIFSTVTFTLPLIHEGSCQFLAKECAQYWLIVERTKPAQ